MNGTQDNSGKLIRIGSRLAVRWLQTNVAKVKEVAGHIGVAETLVYRWARQETSIPADRAEQVIWTCKALKAGIDQLDGETDLYLAEKYGRAA